LHEILWEVSFANLQMYLATIPRFNKEDEPKEEPITVADLFNNIS
jgi:hypothetical protein